MSEIVKEILRVVSSSLQIPTIIILILLILLTILMLGSFVAEIFTERKSLKFNIPGLVDQLQGKSSAEMKEAIENSDLLNRQKESCRELINRVSYNDDTREALARQLIADEEMRYGKIVKITDLISRVAPMFGLMGTLIPLGPGLIALGQGDTSTLSDSLLIAFDTTVAGLISGAISYVVSGIRKGWYEEYMIGLETIMETILDVQGDEKDRAKGQLRGPGVPGAKATPQGLTKAQEETARMAAEKKPEKKGFFGRRKKSEPAEESKPAPQPQVTPQPQTHVTPQPQVNAAPQPQVNAAPQPHVNAAPQPHVNAAHAQPQAPRREQPMSWDETVAEAQMERTVAEPQARPQARPAEPQVEDLIAETVTTSNASRQTMTQPLQAQDVRTNVAQMSRNTQTQVPRPHAEADSKTAHTMVQRTFQEEVRAAEQAMIEAQRRAELEQSRQVLHRPDADSEGM